MVLIVYLLAILEFGGQWPLTIRARCSRFRYFPDPLGIVTAEQFDKLDLWNIQNTMNEPSLSCDHDDKCANSKEKHFSQSINLSGLKLFFQIYRQDSGQQAIDRTDNNRKQTP